jgi:hypothetical protein
VPPLQPLLGLRLHVRVRRQQTGTLRQEGSPCSNEGHRHLGHHDVGHLCRVAEARLPLPFGGRLTETPLMESARVFFRTQARMDNLTIHMQDVHGWRTQVRGRKGAGWFGGGVTGEDKTA